MCGIAGLIRWNDASRAAAAAGGASDDASIVERMCDALQHRGPDGWGIASDGFATLGHRRLSIVDLAGGAQPMRTPDARWSITFNGEIFNHLDLRRDLARRGVAFTTSSDTETLLHATARWERDVPSHLNGMFAFAAWDATERRALLVRDRTGQKPLYWARLDDGSLLFASELKAILASGLVAPVLDPVAIAQYLTYEYVPWPRSAIAGVQKLPPGHRLVADAAGVRVERWYQLPFQAEPPHPTRSAGEWATELRETLARSVERRLMADVPLGVFLSGGIDSTSIVAMMRRVRPPGTIDTFSIAFEESSFDESRWARMAAEHYGTRHHVETFSAERMLAELDGVLAHMDEPFADPSLLPTTLLSAFTRRHVTVALGGDGGDELFLGYETFRADTAARAWRRVPAPLRDAIGAAAERLPVRHTNFSLDFVVRSFLRGADAGDAFRHVRWLSSFLPHGPDDPLVPSLREQVPEVAVWGVMGEAWLACPDPDPLQRLSHAYLTTYMAEDILTKVDRASMQHSLEVRSPFLDPEMLSLAARMPASLKLRHGVSGKWILKEAMRGEVPDAILDRSKKGFGIPVGAWLSGPLRPLVDRLLDPGRVEAGGLLSADVVARLVAAHHAGRANHRKPLWTLLMLQSWIERHDVRLP